MQDSEKFIVDYLKDKFPTLDTRPGTGIRDVLIRPLVGIVDRLREDVDELRDNTNLLNYNKLDTAVLDRLASNWFLTRDIGGKSVGSARIFLSQPEDIEVFGGHRFVYGSANLIFVATGNFFFPKESLQKAQGIDEWYADVNIEAIESGDRYNISPSDFVSYDPLGIHVIRVECVETFRNGKSVENNEQFYERLKKAITVRNLINPLSIETVLRDHKDFFISDLYVAGFGSPEMWRDYISGDLGSFHIGNMTDIYVKTPVITRTRIYTVDGDGKIFFPQDDIPVYRVVKFNGSDAGIPGIEHETDFLAQYSRNDVPYLQTALAPGAEVEVVFDTINLDLIDAYLHNSEHRVVTASLMVRGLAPIYVSFDVRYRMKPAEMPVDETLILSAVKQYINDLPIGTAPDVSDIDMLVRSLYQGIDRVAMPLTMNGALYDFEGSRIEFSSQDVLLVAENTDKSLSQRTVVYIADVITVGAI